ncbi:MAG: hypothetical protein KJ077_22120 [Anaerolineae bacterium]|nr:hypothetical protein [Anaerolineae bacterium]
MKKVMLWLVVGLFILTGCEGGTTVEVNSHCNSSGRSGVCMVTLVSIDGGPYRFKIENDSFWSGAEAVQVTAQVSVEKGRLQVWLEDPEGNKIAENVKPGQSVELKGAADMISFSDERSFSVYFEPQGDAKRAENVQAEIHYDMP